MDALGADQTLIDALSWARSSRGERARFALSRASNMPFSMIQRHGKEGHHRADLKVSGELLQDEVGPQESHVNPNHHHHHRSHPALRRRRLLLPWPPLRPVRSCEGLRLGRRDRDDTFRRKATSSSFISLKPASEIGLVLHRLGRFFRCVRRQGDRGTRLFSAGVLRIEPCAEAVADEVQREDRDAQ